MSATAPAPQKRDMVISFVRFLRDVEIGQRGMPEWSASQSLMSSTGGHGKTTCVDKGAFLLMTYEAGDIYHEIEIPKTNVAQVTKVDAGWLAKKLEKR